MASARETPTTPQGIDEPAAETGSLDPAQLQPTLPALPNLIDPQGLTTRPPTPAQATTSRTRPRVDLLALLGQVVREGDVARKHRMFVNRNLRMDQIDLIGFDMDYTLAIYKQRPIEALSVRCTLEKLVAGRGYPREILDLDYDPNFAMRGLVVDRRYGNIVKMDRYGHVGRAYRGHARLEREEKRRLYRLQRARLSSPRYAWIDTLFALPEAVMFATLVEFFEAQPGRVRYNRLWQDIRDCIDEAHRDDSIKRVVKADLASYFERDDELPATLHKFRSSGKRLFVLTNSFWDYTDAVMSFLLDGKLDGYPSWRNYFDVIIVGGMKPAFFTERRPFIELDAHGREKGTAEGPLLRGHIYQGGNVSDLEGRIGHGGDRVLYIGDHIYGDMLRAKKSSVWRTAMVVQELEQEIVLADKMVAQTRRIEELERRRVRVESELNYQQLVLRQLARMGPGEQQVLRQLARLDDAVVAALDSAAIEATRAEVRRTIEELKSGLQEVGEELHRLEREIDEAFNPWWGQLFKEGVENSRFGEQAEDYACVYTSRVSNFLAYSPLQYFRSPRDHMPHEL